METLITIMVIAMIAIKIFREKIIKNLYNRTIVMGLLLMGSNYLAHVKFMASDCIVMAAITGIAALGGILYLVVSHIRFWDDRPASCGGSGKIK